jgi:ParB-like chromosome segregation protein Spo0J
MQIEQRKLADIKPYDRNPRVNDDAIDAVATSIREFGFRQPIVVDEQFVIIVGHTRYKAALKLNLDTVPVHIAKGLSPAQAKAYRIADNQTARLSEWDYDRLPIELTELQDMEFPLDLVGFSADELQRLMGVEEGHTDSPSSAGRRSRTRQRRREFARVPHTAASRTRSSRNAWAHFGRTCSSVPPTCSRRVAWSRFELSYRY